MWRVTLLVWWLLGSLVSCCPQDCRCFTDDDGYKVANCSKSGLIAAGLSPTIDVLNFKNQLRGSQTKLEARIFRNFRGVKYLNLQNSSISRLPNDVFLGLSRVSRINLSFNKIKHPNGVVFKPLRELRYLSLRGNFLSISPLEVIVSDTLLELDMGHCSLTNIPLYTFSSTPSLSRLILDGNFIQTLEYNVLPTGLHYLNLANNNIVKPPINVFNSLRLLVKLDISNNPINCSCTLLVFQDTLSGRAGLLENGVICNNPPHLFGKKISDINENQLCQDDYMNREGFNNWPYSRKKQNHHHGHSLSGYQSDEPLMGDESYGQKEAAQVMFTNDETNQMGTHMETGMSSYGASDDDKFSQTEGTTTVSKKESGSPETMDPQDLTLTDTETLTEHTDPEGVYAPHDEIHSSPSSDATEPPEVVAGEEIHSTSREDNVITLSSSDPTGSVGDHSNTLHAFDVGLNDTETTLSTEALTDLDGDVELLSNSTSIHEGMSSMGLVEKTTEDSTSEKRFTLPTSATEPADYSYDAQHDDYGVADNATSAETTGVEDSLTEPEHMSSSTDRTPEFEGSGDVPEETESSSVSSSTVGFLEEHETETEPSLQTVSDDLVDVPSPTSTDFIASSTDESSTPESSAETSTEPTIGSSSETSGIERSTEASSPEPSTEASSPEPSTEASSPEPSTEASSPEPSTEASSPEPSTEASSPEPSTEASSPEPSTEISSEGTSSTEQSSPSEEPPEDTTPEISTEHSTELPVVSSSPEPSSTEATSVEPSVSSSTESTVVSSTSERLWWESGEEETSPSSSVATPVEEPIFSSSIAPDYKKGKSLEFTTESTKDNEVDVGSNVGSEKNEPMKVDKAREEVDNDLLTTGVTFIIIGLLISLVLILLTIILCRRKKSSKKIRLPTDPEASAGTELQDMLLPKPPENGIKVLPKNYTNGSTPVNGKTKEPEATKEEQAPVLAPEPEPEPEPAWDDKPEPIEAVTARLTMLARPQTPIFIQKNVT